MVSPTKSPPKGGAGSRQAISHPYPPTYRGATSTPPSESYNFDYRRRGDSGSSGSGEGFGGQAQGQGMVHASTGHSGGGFGYGGGEGGGVYGRAGGYDDSRTRTQTYGQDPYAYADPYAAGPSSGSGPAAGQAPRYGDSYASGGGGSGGGSGGGAGGYGDALRPLGYAHGRDGGDVGDQGRYRGEANDVVGKEGESGDLGGAGKAGGGGRVSEVVKGPKIGKGEYAEGWTKEDEEAEREYVKNGMFNWKELMNWRFWIRKKWWYWYVIIIILCVLVGLMALYKDDIVRWLTPVTQWMRDLPGGYGIPIAILVVLNFPPLFGQEIVCLLCGLVWGLWFGFGIVAAGTMIGEILLFFAMKYCLRGYAIRLEEKNPNYACLAHVVRNGGFFILFVIRFSAIPGHFSTAVFATCGVGVVIFTLATVLTLPKQMILVYLGTIFGNTNEKDNTEKIVTYVTLIVGLLLTVGSMWWIYVAMKKAKLIIWRRERLAQKAAAAAGEDTDAPGAKLDRRISYREILEQPNDDIEALRPMLAGESHRRRGRPGQGQGQGQGQGPRQSYMAPYDIKRVSLLLFPVPRPYGLEGRVGWDGRGGVESGGIAPEHGQRRRDGEGGLRVDVGSGTRRGEEDEDEDKSQWERECTEGYEKEREWPGDEGYGTKPKTAAAAAAAVGSTMRVWPGGGLGMGMGSGSEHEVEVEVEPWSETVPPSYRTFPSRSPLLSKRDSGVLPGVYSGAVAVDGADEVGESTTPTTAGPTPVAPVTRVPVRYSRGGDNMSLYEVDEPIVRERSSDFGYAAGGYGDVGIGGTGTGTGASGRSTSTSTESFPMAQPHPHRTPTAYPDGLIPGAPPGGPGRGRGQGQGPGYGLDRQQSVMSTTTTYDPARDGVPSPVGVPVPRPHLPSAIRGGGGGGGGAGDYAHRV